MENLGGIKMGFDKTKMYREISTGLVVTYDEMMIMLEELYLFDEFTPMSEAWDIFEEVDE